MIRNRSSLHGAAAVLVAAVVCALGPVGEWHARGARAASLSASQDPGGVVILYTTDTLGVLEPCGCSPTGGLAAGLARRAPLVAALRAQFGDVLVLDGGNAAGTANKASVTFDAMRRLGYRAVGLGLEDLLARDAVLAATAKTRIDVISSLPDLNKLPSVVKRSGIYTVQGRRAAVIAVSPAPVSLSVPDLVARLDSLVRDAQSKADLVILLSQLGLKTDHALAEVQGSRRWVDLIIGNADAASLTEPEVIGRTWILPTSTRGTEVGLVEVRWEGGQPRYRFERLPVDARYEPDPAIQKQIDDFRAAQTEALRAASERTALAPSAERFRVDYVSAPDCGTCHPKAYEAWTAHRHGRAVRTLHARKRLVPECLSCHSEGYRRTDEFAWRDGLVDGVQCSTCHGPGVIHRLLKGKGGITRRVDEASCKSCHNKDRDPRFDYEQALQRIRHW